MRKNLRIIQTNGVRGIFLALFAVSCLIAGIIAFPAIDAMHVWNFFIGTAVASINFFQGLLLWGIVVTSVLIFNKKRAVISFVSPREIQELSEFEAKQVLERFKAHSKIIDVNELAKKIAQDSEVATDKETAKQEECKE